MAALMDIGQGRRRAIASALIVILAVTFGLWATAPHSIVLDGNMNDWASDEIVWLDSQNDSVWGGLNELYKLGVTWDNNNFYFGLGAVLSSGNHLIVYIATGTSGISSAADLRKPEDINSRWYWAKNNHFPTDFRPMFQWHSYQTEFKSAGGQGLYHYVYNPAFGVWQAQAATYSSSPQNPDSDGGVYREVEVSIPWSVLYGGTPEDGRTIKLIVAICGGTDEGSGYYGSAHETIPDQTNNFPAVWYDSYTFTSYLSVVYDSGNNRSPIARNLIVQAANNQAKITWNKRGAQETGTYRIYYSTDVSLVQNLKSEYTETSENEIYLNNLTRKVTYYVTLSRKDSNSETGRSEIKSFILKGPLISHQPVGIFSYPGKKCRLSLSADRTLTVARLGWRSGDRSDFQEVNLLSIGNTYYYDLAVPENSPVLDYYFVVADSEASLILPSADDNYYSVNISSTAVVEWNGKLIIPDEYNNSDFSSCLTGGEFLAGDIFRVQTFGFNDLDSQALTSLPDGLTLVLGYEICLQRGEKIYSDYLLDSPANLFLRHLSDYDVSQLSLYRFAGRWWQKITSTTDNNRLRAEIKSLGKFGIFVGTPPASPVEQKIVRIAHPIFAPVRGEFLEFIFDYNPGEISLAIYDLTGRKVYSGSQATWNGRDSSGQIVEGGIYIYQLNYDGRKLTGSCVILR